MRPLDEIDLGGSFTGDVSRSVSGGCLVRHSRLVLNGKPIHHGLERLAAVSAARKCFLGEVLCCLF